MEIGYLKDWATRVIHHHMTHNVGDDPEVEEAVAEFERYYGPSVTDNRTDDPTIPVGENYVMDTKATYPMGDERRRRRRWGVGLTTDVRLTTLTAYFKTFDPVNAVGDFETWTDYRQPSHGALKEAHDYLTDHRLFNRSLLRTTRRDHTVHALISLMLHWTDEWLAAFEKLSPGVVPLASLLMSEKRRAPVYTTADGVPFVRSSFRVLTRYFDTLDRRLDARTAVERPLFRIRDYVSAELVAHFDDVYRWLLTECMTRTEIDLLESHMPSPFAAIAQRFGASLQDESSHKVITGVACCGKTTLLNELKSCGWTVCSRGDLGTFSGKSKSAPAIAGLHAAMENALRRGDVLGDRGPVDNPLWSIIMPLCDPKYRNDVVDELLRFFNGTVNEHVIAYMCQQRVVVFIDPYPSCNRTRMLRRCENGDAFRARINMYPIAQAIAYYMAARLYGWTVRCVPYDENRKFRPERYRTIAAEIKRLFGRPVARPPPEASSKPDGHHLTDTEYSTATGIFK